MQTCQPAARLTLHRLPFSPWANQTELWEGRPRLWCLCRRGNSAWQLLAFRQQPVFMEIIPPYSRCSGLLLITARTKTKLSFFYFFFFFRLFRLSLDSLELAKTTRTPHGVQKCAFYFAVVVTCPNFGFDQKSCDTYKDAWRPVVIPLKGLERFHILTYWIKVFSHY